MTWRICGDVRCLCKVQNGHITALFKRAKLPGVAEVALLKTTWRQELDSTLMPGLCCSSPFAALTLNVELGCSISCAAGPWAFFLAP